MYFSSHSTLSHLYLYITHSLCDGALVFGGHLDILDGIFSFEMYLYPTFTTHVLEIITAYSCVKQYHVFVVTFVVVRCVVAVGVFDVVFVVILNI